MIVRGFAPGRMAAMLTAVLLSCDQSDLGLAPTEGSKQGGVDVRIEGSNFAGHGPPVVHFGGTPAKAVVIESDRLIRVTSPEAEALGTVDVNITFADGTTQRLAQAFTYVEPPPLEIVAPRG